MTYIVDVDATFAIYSSEELAEGVARALFDDGYTDESIQALRPRNESTRKSARRMKTQMPSGVADAPTAPPA